jgi:integrase
MKWCVINGYVDLNFFEGMRLKKLIRMRDERDRFEERELKQIFQKQNYIEFTEVEKGKWEYYWCPLISTFSGMRLNEICSLYLDNIILVKGNHREKRWCFNILEEPDRPDKHIKTLSSRRIVPIHDTLIDLGFIEFVELLKKRHTNRKRLFQELKLSEGSYIRNVSRFFNRRYLTKLGLKTDRKTFHSIRHTVIDHLKQQGIDVSFINELVGHSSGNIDLDRYGKGYNSDILFNKCVSKILYQTSHTRGIDFKSLKLDWGKIITTRVW